MSIITNINDSDLRSFKVNDEIVVDKNVIGEFIKNSAQLTILNKNHTYDSLEKTYLNINKFGLWHVDDLKNNEESVEANLTLSDLSIKFDEDYEDSFSFPATLGEWATWIGNKTGVPLKGTFLNSNKILKEKPYLGNNPKYRTAVKIIAKYACGWAEVNEDKTYSIRWFDDSVEEIEDWESFKHGNETSATNILILSTGVTENNVRYPEQIPTTPHELRIEDDWLVIDRYDISKSIFEQINGFLYTPITELILPYGLLEFKVGQKIRTKDFELNDIETYITSHSLNWDGGDWEDSKSWTSTLKMNELKETTTKYQYSNSIESRVGRTEINCDKNNKKIDMLVEDVDTIEKDITTSKTATGNPIEIDDAGEYPLKSIKIEGKSQEIINYLKNEGKNASMNGVTYTFNEDGSITIKGTATNTSYAMILGESLFDYSKERFKIETDYVASGWYNSNIRLIGRGTDSKYYNIYQGNVADIKNVSLSLVYIQVVTGATIDETIYPMISNKASSFVPPGTWLKLISSNKNLFNSNDCISFNGHIANGILSYNSGNKVLVFPCAPNKKYAISKKSGDRFRIGSYPTFANKGITLNNYISNDNTNILTITTGSNDKYLYIEYWVNIEEASEKEIINSIQIETNEPTEYIAHEENTALIDLNIYNDSGKIIAHYEINDEEIFKNGVLSKKDGETHSLPYTILNMNKGYNYVTLNDELYPNMEIEYLLDSKLNDTYVSKSQFAMESDKIHLEVSKKLDNIDIGGTNLLPGTQLLDNSKIDIKSNLKLNAYKNFSSSSLDLTNSTINYDDCLRWYETLTLEPNNEYTLSFYAKGTKVRTYIYPDAILQGTSSQGLSTNITDGKIEFSLTSEWRKYWVTYKTLSNISGKKSLLFRVLKGENAEICGVKLEHGNKNTDWDPSPNDIKAELELKVSKNDSNQIVSMLNASADEITFAGGSKINISTVGKLIISAGNFRLDAAGNITATGGTIGGFSLSKNSFSTNINGIYDYDRNDINVVQQMLLRPSYFEAIKNIYDANNDGKLDALDLLIVQKIIDKTMSNNKKVSGIFTINTANPKHCITLSAYGQTLFDLGIGMLYVANADFGQASVGGRNIIVGDDEGDCIWQLWIQQGASPRLVIETYNTAYAVGLSTSDQRLKHDIDFTKIKALPLIEKINHREFVYNNDENNELVKIGYIADELQEIDEQLVFEVGKDKIKQINQLYLEALLSKGEQELYQLLKKQQEQIDELKDRVTKLEKERGNYEEIK